MSANDESHTCQLAAKIDEAEAKLEFLESEIEVIGQPAAHELSRRVEALRIEHRALKRNFGESQNGGGVKEERLRKIEILLRKIENEEESVEHAAAFLHQGAPSTVVMAVEAGAKVAGSIGRKMKETLGPHLKPQSVFVNHSHDELVEYHGLKDE